MRHAEEQESIRWARIGSGTAATAMRRAGAPLFEIGKVLRHQVAASSALYAKDDLSALARIARPWPGAQQ